MLPLQNFLTYSMQKIWPVILVALFFTTCKKDGGLTEENKPKTTQLYPLVEGSKWIPYSESGLMIAALLF